LQNADAVTRFIIKNQGGGIMDAGVKEENYRKLSIAALITGLLTYTIGFFIKGYPSFYVTFSQMIGHTGALSARFIIQAFISIVLGFGLPITAVVCGSIDLQKVLAGILSNKGKGFDITGIILGSIYLILRILEEIGLIHLSFG
jgi:hypothetical protein